MSEPTPPSDKNLVPQVPTFRWGTTATVVTGVLGGLLGLSLFDAGLTKSIIVLASEVIGGTILTMNVVFRVPFIREFTLRSLLRYRGWAYHPQSALTGAYMGAVSFLGGRKPRLWAFQKVLPPLPVPRLQTTIDLFLTSVEPHMTPEEFEETKAQAQAFVAGEGKTLQRKLEERERRVRGETSWLCEWWENKVYLEGRYPLPLYSNWYGLDRLDNIVTKQSARAANIIAGALRFKEKIDTQTLDPIRVGNTIPLCMSSYSRLFGAVRVPHVGRDELAFYPQSTHVAVLTRNKKWFRLECYSGEGKKRKILSEPEIEYQIARIARMAEESGNEEGEDIAALTGLDRHSWAMQRTALCEYAPENASAIHCIESALFVVCLDDNEPTDLSDMARLGMHRNAKGLWFDKNLNVIIFKNGAHSSNSEHSMFDATTVLHLYQYIYATESVQSKWVDRTSHLIAPEKSLPEPTQLLFKLNDEFEQTISKATESLKQLASEFDVKVLTFNYFGKGLIKKLSMSPDAFCQMALQLAFYRIHKKLALSYESGATFRFLHGRTDTVRSSSMAARQFVEAMDSNDCTAQQKADLLKKATKQHVRYMRKCTNGDGADRHLLGLKLMAQETNPDAPLPSFFDTKAYKIDFRISSSQTPGYDTCGGGFAPLCSDGYGASYVVAEDRIWFHCSSYASCPDTSAERYAVELENALLAMYEVCRQDGKYDELLSSRKMGVLRTGNE